MREPAECHAKLSHGGDIWAVGKVSRYAPVVRRVTCLHVHACPNPAMFELPVIPNRILSPRVLEAMTRDELDKLRGTEHA